MKCHTDSIERVGIKSELMKNEEMFSKNETASVAINRGGS